MVQWRESIPEGQRLPKQEMSVENLEEDRSEEELVEEMCSERRDDPQDVLEASDRRND